jgi:hypothetical protein
MPKENSVNDDTQDGEHSTTERTPIDIEASEQALSTFKSLLKTALHPRELEMWVMDSVLRQNLFADLAIGQVKWPKALGRPAGPDLSVGFVFEAQFWVDIWHIGLDGTIPSPNLTRVQTRRLPCAALGYVQNRTITRPV